MPKATPSKAELPKKPKKPALVKDPEINATRQSDYEKQLADYTKAMAAYAHAQAERKAEKRKKPRTSLESEGLTFTSLESEGLTFTASPAVSPAAKTPAASPAAKPGCKRRLVCGRAEPTMRQLCAAVRPGYTVFGNTDTDSFPSFVAEDPARLQQQTAWAEAIGAFAERCG